MTDNIVRVYTMEDVDKHSSSKDRWLVVDGKVYDVTKYIKDHPGGEDIMMEKNQTDGSSDLTDMFNSAGHSTDARAIMAGLCIGNVKANRQLTYEEVNKHNTEDDKWIAINGKVYDISKYLKAHPGGPDVILGQKDDSTQAFEDVGHSQAARDTMKEYYVGDITGYVAVERKSSLPIVQILIVFLVAILAYIYGNLPKDSVDLKANTPKSGM